MIDQLIDTFAQTNPAFCALTLRWLVEGYQSEEQRPAGVPLHISIVWAIVGLVLLIPEDVRRSLPSTTNARLPKLIREHSEWRLGMVDAIRATAGPFWAGCRFAVATGLVTYEGGRLRAVGRSKVPVSDIDQDLRKKARTLGRLLAREGDDAVLSTIFDLAVGS